MKGESGLNPDRYFSSNLEERAIARQLYQSVKDLPLVSPHGHVEPRLLAENRPFPDPTELLVIPDHYLFRMLYSQGVAMTSVGIPRRDRGDTEQDHRKIWQIVADNFYLFRATPTGMWLKHEIHEVLGVTKPFTAESAMEIYDEIVENLAKPENLPRALFERFNLEVLCTTDSPTDSLRYHKDIRDDDWDGRVVPAFRPDNVTDLCSEGWTHNIERLSEISGIDCSSYSRFIQALEKRRLDFKELGATSTDHGVRTPFTVELTEEKAAELYEKALSGRSEASDARLFTGHMLLEMARMSCDDGLVMQIHPGSYRNYNQRVFEWFGPDKGADIPSATDYVGNLKPLLDKFGNEKALTVVLFTLDETTFSRELAPLAGHFPILRLGPPWWFHDSLEGMLRFRKSVTETAGFYNTVGFIDDTRAFPSIPVRHDLARRVDCRYLAELVATHVLDMDEAQEIVVDLAYNLVKKTYNF